MTGDGDGVGSGVGDGDGSESGVGSGLGRGIGPGNEEFEVWRQDDNGNHFLMSRHPDRASAEAAVAAIEAGIPHKQLYYLKRAEPRR